MSIDESDEFLDVTEVAALLRVGPEAVYRQLRSGKMPGRKLGREWRVSKRALLGWMAASTGPAADADRVR